MGKLSFCYMNRSYSICCWSMHQTDVWRTQWTAEGLQPFEFNLSQSLKKVRKIFIHIRYTNCQSLKNVLNKYVRKSDRKELLKQKIIKKKKVLKVLKVYKYLLSINPECISTLPLTKSRIIEFKRYNQAMKRKHKNLVSFIHVLQETVNFPDGFKKQHYRGKQNKITWIMPASLTLEKVVC